MFIFFFADKNYKHEKKGLETTRVTKNEFKRV